MVVTSMPLAPFDRLSMVRDVGTHFQGGYVWYVCSMYLLVYLVFFDYVGQVDSPCVLEKYNPFLFGVKYDESTGGTPRE
jgi:hypothetical protein